MIREYFLMNQVFFWGNLLFPAEFNFLINSNWKRYYDDTHSNLMLIPPPVPVTHPRW